MNGRLSRRVLRDETATPQPPVYLHGFRPRRRRGAAAAVLVVLLTLAAAGAAWLSMPLA